MCRDPSLWYNKSLFDWGIPLTILKIAPGEESHTGYLKLKKMIEHDEKEFVLTLLANKLIGQVNHELLISTLGGKSFTTEIAEEDPDNGYHLWDPILEQVSKFPQLADKVALFLDEIEHDDQGLLLLLYHTMDLQGNLTAAVENCIKKIDKVSCHEIEMSILCKAILCENVEMIIRLLPLIVPFGRAVIIIAAVQNGTKKVLSLVQKEYPTFFNRVTINQLGINAVSYQIIPILEGIRDNFSELINVAELRELVDLGDESHDSILRILDEIEKNQKNIHTQS